MVSVLLLAIALSFVHHFSNGNATPASNAQAIAICNQLYSHLGADITLPSAAQYNNLSDENWSQTAWEQPSCIALPTTTSALQTLVKTLVSNNVPFAIRAGGHSPNPFYANINAGVLISLDNFDTVTYDAIHGIASIGTGARWGAVYTALDPYNVTIVGGRVNDVGVGGLTLGSGLSYLSDLYGLVCDNVLTFEVVLANGDLVEASSSQNSELFYALKGGSNNFGIVTKITTPSYPIYEVWGSVLVYGADQMPTIMQALYKYQTTPDKDLYANLVLNLAPTNGSIILTLVYLKPIAMPAAYTPFYSLTPLVNTTAFFTLHQLQSLFPLPALPRWTWYTVTFEPNSELFSQIATVLATAPEVSTIASLQAGTVVAAVQPIAANVALAGQARGGNALGLQPVTQTFFAIDAAWWNAKDDQTVYTAIQSIHNKIETLAKNLNVHLEYIFMNDANFDQSVIASYGQANVQRLQAVQARYDPQLVFQRLVPGGQKIPEDC